MTALTSLGLFIFAVIVFAIRELHAHGKLKWMEEDFSFWGKNSYLRKYQNIHKDKSKFQVNIPLGNWYYNFFKIRYHEAFPGSATILVFVTDAPHALQLAFKLLIIGSLVMYKEIVNPWVDAGIYFLIWQLVFNVVYRELSK